MSQEEELERRLQEAVAEFYAEHPDVPRGGCRYHIVQTIGRNGDTTVTFDWIRPVPNELPAFYKDWSSRNP